MLKPFTTEAHVGKVVVGKRGKRIPGQAREPDSDDEEVMKRGYGGNEKDSGKEGSGTAVKPLFNRETGDFLDGSGFRYDKERGVVIKPDRMSGRE